MAVAVHRCGFIRKRVRVPRSAPKVKDKRIPFIQLRTENQR